MGSTHRDYVRTGRCFILFECTAILKADEKVVKKKKKIYKMQKFVLKLTKGLYNTDKKEQEEWFSGTV